MNHDAAQAEKSFGAIGRNTTTIFFFSASYCDLSEDNSICVE
jgi:hypothetical protein